MGTLEILDMVAKEMGHSSYEEAPHEIRKQIGPLGSVFQIIYKRGLVDHALIHAEKANKNLEGHKTSLEILRQLKNASEIIK